MSSPAEQIKERLSIADVVGSYLKLERAGSSLKAKCPFHNEKTPSFFVSPARGSYYCFGCNKGGDIFSFVQEFEGTDFVGALRILAQRAGVELKRIDPKVRSAYARLYLLLEKATRFFEGELQKNSEAKKYLESRGLRPETISAWRLGFAQNDWRQLHDHLLKEGFKPEEMEKVGLVKRKAGPLPLSKGETREGVMSITTPRSPPYYHPQGSPSLERRDGGEVRSYDAFRGRVMFPIRDSAGRVIGFSARILPSLDDGKTGKYINSPETVLFRKSEVLYGFDKAKLAIRQKDAAILVEGQMDLLMAHQAGYEHTVASSGTALTEAHLRRLKQLSENLLIAFDSDSAGLKASERAIRLALSLGMNVRVIALKEKDPADLILHSKDEWEHAVKEAKHIIDFLLDGLLASEKENRAKALAIEKQLLPLLQLLPSRVEQSHFLKTIADRSGLREDALFETFKKLPAPNSSRSQTLPKSLTPADATHSNTVERRVFAILFLAETRKAEELLKRLTEELTRILGSEKLEARKAAHAALRDPLLVEAEALYGEGLPSAREEAELLRRLEEEEVREQLQAVMGKLAGSERGKRSAESGELLREAKVLSERLSTLTSARFSQ